MTFHRGFRVQGPRVVGTGFERFEGRELYGNGQNPVP